MAEAAKLLLPDLYGLASQTSPEHLWTVSGSEACKQEQDDLRDAFVRLLADSSGKYEATGIAHGETEVSRIPPYLWHAAIFALGLPGEPELQAEIIADGRSWSGVRVNWADPSVATPPPTLVDLPLWWTLEQACAWIALRDAAAVAGAAPPGHGREASGKIGWHATYHRRKHSGGTVGPDLTDASEALLAALQRGAVRSRGRRAGVGQMLDISTTDWATLHLQDDHPKLGGKWAVTIGWGIASFWRAVVVCRDDVVVEWPPFEAEAQSARVEATDALLQALPMPAAPARLHQVASTIAAETRLEKWLAAQMRTNPNNPPGKAAIKAEAKEAGHLVSERAFARAFGNAVRAADAPAWSAPGRKSKRRIETAG
ncbi:hypothetical protein [Roseicella aquatilis]|uniref:Uncharacterized protein n=1 Tax=Roseicella aquatilis TaxID=2527868 RepID=A0A4R4DV36_9PROT|nr:hypothetical protein [Roseicella aquatilis]TCZ64300.1 hypothetical protein EXY23_06515 [Roseicella aquatilis]